MGLCRMDGKPLSPACARFSELFEDSLTRSGHDAVCAQNLPHYLRIAGFADFTVQVCSLPLGAWAGDQGVIGKDLAVRGYKNVAGYIATSNAMTRAQYLTLIDDLADELDSVEGTTWTVHVVQAMKPLS